MIISLTGVEFNCMAVCKAPICPPAPFTAAPRKWKLCQPCEANGYQTRVFLIFMPACYHRCRQTEFSRRCLVKFVAFPEVKTIFFIKVTIVFHDDNCT